MVLVGQIVQGQIHFSSQFLHLMLDQQNYDIIDRKIVK